MRAQVLSIGSELILGHLTDTNATFLAQQLASIGAELLTVTQVGDDRTRIATVIRRALEDADAVICTGGIGPTEDDLTREAISEVVGETPTVDPELLQTLQAFFAGRGIEMPARNRKQAWLIPSSEALANPIGTAPGWFVRHHGKVIVAMPGVPREMFRMWREQALPRLIATGQDRVYSTTTIRTIGIGESAAEEVIDDLVRTPNPVVATYAKDDGVQIRVTATAAARGEADAMRGRTVAEIERRLADYVYGHDETGLPEALVERLTRAGLTLAVLDHGGGGRFGSLMAAVPASSALLRAAAIDFGADLPAPRLAESIAHDTHADLGLGIRLIATNTGNGVFEGPIEIAIRGAATLDAAFPMRAGYDDLQRRSALYAAHALLRALRTR